MAIRAINTFMEIADYIISPSEKTLFICDIDETILTQKVELVNGFYNYSVKWTDYIGFHRIRHLVEQNGKLIFLTARHPASIPFTIDDFAKLGLNYDDFEVHYTGNLMSKGEYIIRYIDTTPYNRVIFVDDLIPNIYTVKRAVPSAFCFLFCADGV